MCFIKDNKHGVLYKYRWWKRKDGQHKIAEEGIVCYKVMLPSSFNKDAWYSPLYEFYYIEGKQYIERSVPLKKLDRLNCLGEGVFHSYIKPQPDYYYVKCVKCIIPAGTPYWVNEENWEYASTAIKVIGRV